VHPACKKLEWWGAGVVICLERGADLHMAQLIPLPLTVSCFSKIQIGSTFLVPAHPGSPGQRAVKRGCACVCVCVCLWQHDECRYINISRSVRLCVCGPCKQSSWKPSSVCRRTNCSERLETVTAAGSSTMEADDDAGPASTSPHSRHL